MENANKQPQQPGNIADLFYPTMSMPQSIPAAKWYAQKHQAMPDCIYVGRVHIDKVLKKYPDSWVHLQKTVTQNTRSPLGPHAILEKHDYIRKFDAFYESLTGLIIEIEPGMYVLLSEANTHPQTFNSSANATIYYQAGKHDITEIENFLVANKMLTSNVGSLGIMVNTTNGLDLRHFTVPNPEIDFDINYNEDFKEVHEHIYSSLTNEKGKGLVILHGKPGTGKTTYIRWLINNIQKTKIYIPPNFVNELAHPGLLTFLLNYPNAVIFVEDAENVFMKREGQNNQAVSNVLNFTDGLLGDCLNLQVVATFNTPLKNIDEALLRKGRLIARYEFTELEFDRAEKLADKMRIFLTDSDGDKLTLADIYNSKNKW